MISYQDLSKKINNGILIRLGYRDNMQDAKWLVENKDKIALKIAEIIIKNYNKQNKIIK